MVNIAIDKEAINHAVVIVSYEKTDTAITATHQVMPSTTF
jgi:hypothetical protein